MTASAVDLCNQALRLLGDATISSFEEGTELAETCNQLYADTVRALLAAHPWRFTLVKAQLARLAEAPLNEWTYAHALPSDRLALRELFTSGKVGARTLTAYELFESRVFSDQADIWCDYQRETDPATWPAPFRNLARHALAADFAVAVTGSAAMADSFRLIAYGTPAQGGNGGLLAQARRLDSVQQPPQAVRDFPLIAARLGGV